MKYNALVRKLRTIPITSMNATRVSSVVERGPNTTEDGGSSPSPVTHGRFEWAVPQGLPECPYMIRWKADFGRFGKFQLHHWLRGDDPRALHDHPSDFLTVVLRGSYDDVQDGGCVDHLHVGSVRYRHAEHTHTVVTRDCWTLVYFWPKRRAWGFWYPTPGGRSRWWKANKYHAMNGGVPCAD